MQGLDAATREQNQRRFIRDDVQVIVATVAFGMGIDKPNVRFVLHYNLPPDLETYYQQIGRAGRDGLHADCLLLYSRSDIFTTKFFIDQGAAEEARGRQLRLDAMVRWTESHVCRRNQLLAYFGEMDAPSSCRMCDNCTAAETDQPQDDLTIPAQMFLSCVLRTGERFGINHIVNVLRGSRAKSILQRGHDRLSTYAIGAEHSSAQWQHLARQFIQQGLVVQDMSYGGLQLTARGRAVLNGETVFGTLNPETHAPASISGRSDDTLAYDHGLFEQLRTLRKTRADTANVPPYAIFPDRSLQEMATYFPQSKTSFSTIHGVGSYKLEQYAEVFLPVIRAYCAEHQLEERPKPAGSRAQAASDPSSGSSGINALKARTRRVAQVFIERQSVSAAAETLGIQSRTLVDHLWKFAHAGHHLPVEPLRALSQLSPQRQTEVLAAFDRLGVDFLRPVYDAFDGEIAYEELHLLRLCYYLSRSSNTDGG